MSGTTSSAEVFDLPPGSGWHAFTRGYRYRSNGTVRSLLAKKSPSGQFILKVSGKGPMDLGPPNFGTSVQVVLVINGATE